MYTCIFIIKVKQSHHPGNTWMGVTKSHTVEPLDLNHLDPQFPGPNDEVRVSGGAEGVSYDEEGDIFVLGAGVDAVGFRLHNVAIGQHDVLAVEIFLAVSDIQ